MLASRGADGGQDDDPLGAGRLPARTGRWASSCAAGAATSTGPMRSGRTRLPARQRDERPPPDLRLGPRRAGRTASSPAAATGMGATMHADSLDEAIATAARPARRDRCRPGRDDDLPAVLRLPDAGRHVPPRRGGVAPAPRCDGALAPVRLAALEGERSPSLTGAQRLPSRPSCPAMAAALEPAARPRSRGLRCAGRQPRPRAGRA